MGCFLGCFGSSKDHKPRKHNNKHIPADQNPRRSQNLVQDDASLVQTTIDKPSKELSEEPLNLSNRKKVTFDTNITAYQHVQEINNTTQSLLETNEKCQAFPPNHRYGNCLDGDDEAEVSDSEDENLDEDIEQEYGNEDGIICQEVWCESILVESDSSLNPVLKPVENLTQWKALKSKGPQKENSITSIPFPHKNRNQEPSVDASLSNWLVSTEKNTSNNKRVGSYTPDLEPVSQESSSTNESIEDRPILGALTVDELKQFSESTCTPRKSPSRSPDDMPIIGSVGSYWSQTGSAQSLSSVSSYKGIPNTTSKYREDKKVNWHNTPFETRLERALNRDAAATK